MGSKLTKQADIVKGYTESYLDANTKYSEYLNGTAPILVTYYQIIPEASREDYSLEDVHSLTGKNSPISYRRIKHVTIYGIDALNISNELTQRGIESSIAGSGIIVPAVPIRPVIGEFFVIEGYGLDDHLFQISDVQYDKASSNKYYQFSYKLRKENTAIIFDNVIEECILQEKGDGSGKLEIATEEEAATQETLQNLIDGLIDKYEKMFYDPELDNFIYKAVDQDDGGNYTNCYTYYFCPYINHFLHQTGAFDRYTSEFMTEIYISDITEELYPFIYNEDAYRNSIYYAVEMNDFDILNFTSSFAGISSFNLSEPLTLPFFTTGEKYRLVELFNPGPEPKNMTFRYGAFHIILGNERELFGDIDFRKKFIDIDDLDELDECYEINSGDLLYQMHKDNPVAPINVYQVIANEDGEGELVDANIHEMIQDTDHFLDNDYFIFNIIRNYFNKTFAVTEDVVKAINNYYYKKTMTNYLLLPIVIYILKQYVSSK